MKKTIEQLLEQAAAYFDTHKDEDECVGTEDGFFYPINKLADARFHAKRAGVTIQRYKRSEVVKPKSKKSSKSEIPIESLKEKKVV